jgi:hypothetical protein
VIAVVGDMEFAASALKKAARAHGLCSHPWDLSCSLIGRWREVAERHRTRTMTLERMGVPRAKGTGIRS